MEALLNKSTIEFQGLLDERTSMDLVAATVEKAAEAAAGAPVRVVFAGVERANSVGILAWAKFVDRINTELVYVNAPEWLVEQFNFCDMLKNGAAVESFQAPFYCPETGGHETVTLVIGKDLPILDGYAGFQLLLHNASGAQLEPDFDPQEYFHFIALNANRFRRNIK